MDITFNETNRFLFFNDYSDYSAPLAAFLFPYTIGQEVSITIKDLTIQRSICYFINEPIDAFPVPHYISDLSDTPEGTYLMLLKSSGEWISLLCLSHDNLSVRLCGNPDETLSLKVCVRNGNGPVPIMVFFRGSNVHDVIKSTFKHALELTGGLGKMLSEKLPSPRWLNRLGWESKCSFGTEITHDKILDAIWSLRQRNLMPGFVIINEGWQQYAINLRENTPSPSMLDFDADKIRFPRGLCGLVEDLHNAGIEHVGVWHSIMGCRGGIHPTLAHKYSLAPDDNEQYFPGHDLGQTFQFFCDYYAFLSKQGITFVKVDSQDTMPYNNLPNINKNLQTSIQAAASLHFNGIVFNSGSLRNENLFCWATSSIAQASDDVNLTISTSAMKWIRNSLTNSLWLQNIMKPDFGTLLTDTPHSETLAIFHALSGSSIIIGDTPSNNNNNTILNKMILPSGNIMKADIPLTLCNDSITSNPLEEKTLYKAYTFKGNCCLVGIFNLSTSGKRILHGTLSPSDIDDLQGNLFALFSLKNGFIGTVAYANAIDIKLKPYDSDIITIAPINDGIAVIGCHKFFIPPAHIIETNIGEDYMHISSIIEAPILLYCERNILEVRRNGIVVPWELEHIKNILSIDTRSTIKEAPSVYTLTFES